MTIDELARAAGITTRNVRAYQDRGLLPPPERLGRMGYYDDVHLARLGVVARLLARGYSLQSIGDLFVTWEEGRSLSDLLGFEEVMAQPRTADDAVHLTEADLVDLYGRLEPAIMQRAVDLGLLRPTDDGYDTFDMKLIEFGRALTEAGYDLGEVLEETRLLNREAHTIAERWLDLWQRCVWDPYVAAGSPPQRLPEITAAMEQIREIPGIAAEALIRLAIREQSDERTARLVESAHERKTAAANAD